MKKVQALSLKGLLALLVGCLLVITLGCSSSSDLDFPDPNNPDESTATVQLLATGILSGARTDLGIYLRAVGTFGRENYYFEPSDPRYTGELLTGPLDPGGFLTTRPWSARYRVVKNCNLLLAKAAETNNAGAAGFAKTMMAYQLLLNLTYTDTNGIRTDVAGTPLGPIVGRPEALAFMASQLDSGLTDLNGAGTAFSFRLTSGFNGFNTPASFAKFNRALRARVAAYQGDWQGTLNALNGSFIDAAGSMNLGVFHTYTTGAGDQVNPMFEVQSGTIKLHAHPSFVSSAEAGDTRFTSKATARATRTVDGLTANHGVTIWTSQTAPMAIIRNEELLLLRAEANINLSNLAAAQADINIVRHAANLGDVTLTSANAVPQLIHERRYSLFSEGHRWVDMRRWGLLGNLPTDRANDVVLPRTPIPTSESL